MGMLQETKTALEQIGLCTIFIIFSTTQTFREYQNVMISTL